jgi:hypothetical protein
MDRDAHRHREDSPVTLSPALRSALPYALIAAAVVAIAAVSVLRSGPARSTVEVELPVARSTLDSGGAGDASRRTSTPPATHELEIVTVLPQDAIPAIFDPQFVSAAEADAQLAADDLVLGVSVAGDHRAYGVAFLSSREVVNDVIGGLPLAVT